MLSDADYKELKAQQKNLNPEGRAALREYELSNPQHADMGPTGAAKLAENEPKGSSLEGSQVGQIPKGAGVNVPALPPEGAPPELGPQSPDSLRLDQYQSQLNASTPGQDQTRDNYLPNASKLKTLAAPPEYVSKNPAAGIKHVIGATLMDPLEGPGVGVYHEPTEKQFQADMGPVLEAKGIAPGHPEYDAAFNEYKDRKWVQAYQKAQATDTPLTRIAYVDHSGAWAQLKDALQEFPDVASSFAKGFASGGTLHATEALETPQDTEQSERDPIARGAGELAGAMNPGSLLARGTGAVGNAASKLLPSGILSRLGIGAAVGAGAGVTDLAGKEAARAVREGSPTAAKDEFLRSLPGAAEMGASFGLGGTALAEGANAFQKHVVSSTPEVAQLRRAGGDTSLLGGVKPGPDVAANVEAAREPLPGEAKEPPEGNATEIAAKKVQGPLTETNAAAHAEAHKTIAAQQDAAIAADPKLQERLPATKTAQAAVDWALAKLQPEARPGYLPGITKPTSAEVLPGADLTEVQKLAPRLWKPRVVTAGEAASAANRARGRAITLDEARQLGLDVGGLTKGLDTEGVPPGAPPIPDDSAFDSAASSANGVAQKTGATPEVQDFLNRSRKAASAAQRAGEESGPSAAVTQFLASAERSGATYPGAVYRGTSPDELASLLKNGETAHTWSVSKDIEGARHFAQKNGVLLKIEGGSGAVPVDGIEGSNTFGEALIPAGQRFEVASDATENGIRTVTLRRVTAPDVGGGSTTEDVFGRPADKITPNPAVSLKPREGRAFKTPTGPEGSDWFDSKKAAETVALHSGDYEVKDPFGGWRTTAPSGKTPLDTPTRPEAAGPAGPPSETPSGPPSALRASPLPVTPPVPPPSSARIGGIPESEYRVILEPRTFDAKTFEEILGDVDRKAKAGSATAQPDPAWKQLQRAIREDRSQFGTNWTDMIAKHHELLNGLEQRSYHAGINEKKPYSEMQGSSQQTMNGKLVDFPGGTDSAKALRDLAEQAGPGVKHDLEVLGAQNAYSKLSGMASPKIGETIGSGGLAGHLRGFGPAVKLRADAVARGISAGPTGEPTITPRLVNFVRQNAPKAKFLPGLTAMGQGALGLKAGSVYNSTRDRGELAQSLTPSERQFLEQLLSATQEAP